MHDVILPSSIGLHRPDVILRKGGGGGGGGGTKNQQLKHSIIQNMGEKVIQPHATSHHQASNETQNESTLGASRFLS